MGTGNRYGRMAASTMASGVKTRQTAMAFLSMQTETYMKVLGTTIKHMDTEPTNMQMEPPMLANGSRINSTARELKSGPTERSTRGSTKTARSTAKVALLSQTEAHTQDLSVIMRYQALVNILGLMEKCTKANGKGTKCMGRES